MSRSARARESGFGVRPMQPADAGRVGEVHVAVWREAYAGLMPADYLAGLSVETLSERWAGRLATPTPGVEHVVGLDPSGVVVAIATAGPPRDEPPVAPRELWAINVLAVAHGSGLADLLLEGLVPGAASLWVLEGNERAIAFYRRHGFAPDGATKPFRPADAGELRMVRA